MSQAAGAMSVAGLQRLNSVEMTGTHGRSSMALDDLVLDHLMQQRALAGLSTREQLYCRLAVEGFTAGEIAGELRVSIRTVSRLASGLQATLYGRNAADAFGRPN